MTVIALQRRGWRWTVTRNDLYALALGLAAAVGFAVLGQRDLATAVVTATFALMLPQRTAPARELPPRKDIDR